MKERKRLTRLVTGAEVEEEEGGIRTDSLYHTRGEREKEAMVIEWIEEEGVEEEEGWKIREEEECRTDGMKMRKWKEMMRIEG